MESITTNVCVENLDFNLCFKNGNFFFDDNFKEFIKKEFETQIFNNQIVADLFSFNYEFFAKNYDNKNIAFDLQEKIIESQKMPNKKGFIYLVSDGQFTKIGGTSYDVKKRLLELQTGNAKKLKIIGSYKCNYLNVTEKLIHNDFKDKKILNEWFSLDDIDCKKILNDKFTFTINEQIKTLSYISIINIIRTQIDLLRDCKNSKIKKNKRLLAKYNIDRNFLQFIRSDKIKNYNNNIVEKYIKKRIDYNFMQLQDTILKQVNKYYSEIIKLQDWIELLNNDLIKYLDENNLEYNDDEDIWVNSDDFENPLKYNNGIAYACKMSDIPSIS